MFSPFSRCFYTFSQNIFSRPLYTYWALYFLDVFIFLYCTPRLIFCYIVLNDQNKIEYYRFVDPAISFFSNIDPFMSMLILLFDLFHVTAETCITQIDLKAPVWQFWRSVTVQLQDDYYKCKLNQVELMAVRKFSQKRLIGLLQRKFPLIYLLTPNWALQLAAQLGAPAFVWIEMKNINQEQFYRQKLFGLPNISKNCKRNATLFLILVDLLTHWLQVIIGKQLINF